MPKNLLKALGYSVLLHALVIAIFRHSYLAEPLVLPLAESTPIAAFIYQAPLVPTPVPTRSEPQLPAPAPNVPVIKKTVLPAKSKPKQTAARVQTSEEVKSAAKPIANSTKAQSAIVTNVSEPVTANFSLAERSLALATRQQQEVSRETLEASQIRPEMRELSNNRSKKNTPAHVAANVLDVQDDGSFIEKIGDYCYQANAGADLRADIFSMKPVSCGENKNDAMFERIMSEVGGGR